MIEKRVMYLKHDMVTKPPGIIHFCFLAPEKIAGHLKVRITNCINTKNFFHLILSREIKSGSTKWVQI